MSLLKKLASVVVTASLVFGLVATAFAAPAPDKVAEGANRLHALGIVNGSDAAHPDDLQLDQQITRAQLMKIMVWAFGQKENASILKGAQAFPDTASHWASGEIAIAKNIIVEKNHETMGMPDGTFSPDGKVTNAQAVAFLMKFIGVKADSSKTWPNNYLDAAVASGMLSASDVESISPIANNPATRGIVFYLADVAFSSFNMANGKTVYTTYVKPNAPVLNVETPVANTTDKSITINGSVGSDAVSLTVNGTAVKPAADGKFTADVELKVGPNNITVVATDIVKGATTWTGKVSRTVGVAASIELSTAAITVAAGESVDFTATVKDKDGNVLTDAQAEITSDLGTYDSGKFTAGTEAKSGTVTVKYGDLSPIEINVTVNPGVLSALNVSPATVDLSAGGSQLFTVTGADKYGNTVAIDSSKVSWTASKGVMGKDGTFGATADAAGTVTVTATSGTVTGTSAVTVFGVPAKIVAAAPSTIVANGVSTTTLTVTVQDANNNPVRNYSGNITFTNSNPTIVALDKTSVAAVNGSATVTLTSKSVVGSSVISVSASGLTGTTATVSTSAQTPTSVTLAADPATVAADGASAVTVTATMVDQTGNPMKSAPSGTWTVDLASSDITIVGPATASGTFGMADGVFKATVASTFYAKNNLGSTSISGTVKKDGTASTTVSASAISVTTALVGVPYKLAIDTITDNVAGLASEKLQKITVRVLDVNGNQVTSATSTAGAPYYITGLTLAADSDSSAVISVNGSIVGGKAVFSVYDTVAESTTWTVNATWNNNNTALVKAEAVGVTVAGDPAKVTLSAPTAPIAANGTATATLTAKITDEHDNAVPTGTYAVTFKRTASANSIPAIANWSTQTVNSVDGKATITVTAGVNVSTDTFTAEAILSGTTATVSTTKTIATTIIGVPNQLAFEATTAKTAGSEATVKVDVKDAAGSPNVVTYDNSTVVTLTTTDSDDVTQTYTATAVNGVATFNFTYTTADTYYLSATASGLKGAGVSGGNQWDSTNKVSQVTQAINAGTAKAVKVASNLSTFSNDGYSVATLTVTLADQYGNSTKLGNLAGFSIASGSTSIAGTPVVKTGSLKNASDVVLADNDFAHAVTAVFTSALSTTPGSATFTAKVTDLTDGTATISTVFAGSAAKLAVTVGDSQKVTVTGGTDQLQKVTVTVTDAQGTRLTAGSGIFVRLEATGTTGQVTSIFMNDKTTSYADGAKPELTAGNNASYSFYVKATKAESVTYKATAYNSASLTLDANKIGNISTITGSGTFTPNAPYQISFVAAPDHVVGDGSRQVPVTATVADRNGNTVTSANGNIKFSVSDGYQYAYLASAGSDGFYTVPVSGGTAVAYLQTRYAATPGTVNLNAKFYDAADPETVAINTTSTNLLSVGAGLDTSAPTVTLTSLSKTGATGFASGDTVVLTFNEATNGPSVTAANFAVSNSHTFGTSPSFAWTTGNTVLTITLGTGATLNSGDTVAFATSDFVKDAGGNNFISNLFTVPAFLSTDAAHNGITLVGAANTTIDAGEKITIAFSDVLGAAPALTDLTISGGHSLGNSTVALSADGKAIVITIGDTGVTLANNDTITVDGTKVKTAANVALGTGGVQVYTVLTANF